MRVIETGLDDNLAPISGYLWSEGIPNRVFEERGRQVLEVGQAEQAERARALYAAWREGRLRLVEVRRDDGATAAAGHRRWLRQFRRHPGLVSLVALTLAVFPFSVALGEGGTNVVAAALLIVDPASLQPGAAAGSWQPWRWLTPILLHFSVPHLAFNCVVIIELGRRIEAARGTLAFLLLVVLIGIAGNVAQLTMGGSTLFGGLSGVGYGLLGFLLVMARREPAEIRWRLPSGFALGLLGFLVLFSTGITEPFGLHVANAAHWGGLVAGALLALGFPARGAPPRIPSAG